MKLNKLEAYESWNLEKPNILSPSRLYPLELVGVDMPYAESLTSYIAILAETHVVTTGILVQNALAPFLKEEDTFQRKNGGIDQIFFHHTKIINGIETGIIKLIHALDSLTLRNDLKFLTMLNWAERIPKLIFLHSVRAWCRIYYENWHRNQQIIYEPLLWSLKKVKVCVHHNQHLYTKSPYSQRENKLSDWNSRPGSCSKCKEWLGLSKEKVSLKPIQLQETEIEWQDWVTQNLGDLIAAAPTLSPLPQRKIHETLSAYGNIIASSNIATLVKEIRRLGMNSAGNNKILSNEKEIPHTQLIYSI